MGDYIKVDLIHNLYKNKKWAEIKFNKFDKIENIKKKIYTHTGASIDTMKLYAYNELDVEKTQICLNNDQYCLNDYNVKDNYTIYIQEKSESSSNDIYNIDDEENLEKLKHLKYQINEEDYDKRQDNFRNFLKKLKEKKKQNIKLNHDTENTNTANNTDNSYDANLYKIGNRCRVILGDRRGTLKFVGNLKNRKGIYVGVDLDEPMGNSDGLYHNQFLFECKGDKYGYIGIISSIEMGNFSPIYSMNLEEF